VAGLILCNPFIHNKAELYQKHYYKQRLFDKDFWARLLELKINFKEAFSETVEIVYASLKHAVKNLIRDEKNSGPFTRETFLESLKHARIPVYCILSANDVVAKEFRESMLPNKALRRNGNIKTYTIDNADHTFSVPGTKDELFLLTAAVLREMGIALNNGAAQHHKTMKEPQFCDNTVIKSPCRFSSWFSNRNETK